MTKTEFKKLEKLCRGAWAELAKNGEDHKPDHLEKYKNYCPACEIAFNTAEVIEDTVDYDWMDEETMPCHFCPIDKWRRKKRCKGASCEKSREAYFKWWTTISTKKRMAAAKLIASYSWTYLPEYKKVDIDIT